MSDTNFWEVVGYIDPTLPGAKIVKPVLRDTGNPDVFFFAEQPDQNIRPQIEGMPKTDEGGKPYLGASNFRPLDTSLKYSNRNLYIRQQGEVGLLAITIFTDDLAEFERVKAALNG